jgi:hypothetical protein
VAALATADALAPAQFLIEFSPAPDTMGGLVCPVTAAAPTSHEPIAFPHCECADILRALHILRC